MGNQISKTLFDLVGQFNGRQEVMEFSRIVQGWKRKKRSTQELVRTLERQINVSQEKLDMTTRVQALEIWERLNQEGKKFINSLTFDEQIPCSSSSKRTFALVEENDYTVNKKMKTNQSVNTSVPLKLSLKTPIKGTHFTEISTAEAAEIRSSPCGDTQRSPQVTSTESGKPSASVLAELMTPTIDQQQIEAKPARVNALCPLVKTSSTWVPEVGNPVDNVKIQKLPACQVSSKPSCVEEVITAYKGEQYMKCLIKDAMNVNETKHVQGEPCVPQNHCVGNPTTNYITVSEKCDKPDGANFSQGFISKEQTYPDLIDRFSEGKSDPSDITSSIATTMNSSLAPKMAETSQREVSFKLNLDRYIADHIDSTTVTEFGKPQSSGNLPLVIAQGSQEETVLANVQMPSAFLHFATVSLDTKTKSKQSEEMGNMLHEPVFFPKPGVSFTMEPAIKAATRELETGNVPEEHQGVLQSNVDDPMWPVKSANLVASSVSGKSSSFQPLPPLMPEVSVSVANEIPNPPALEPDQFENWYENFSPLLGEDVLDLLFENEDLNLLGKEPANFPNT